MPDNAAQIFTVTQELDGLRLDAAMAAACPEISRSTALRLIGEGLVRIDGQAAGKPSRKMIGGETVEFLVPPPVPSEVMPEDIALEVLYEDSHIIVIAKPAGMVVHPAPGHSGGTLVNALLHHCTDLSGIGGTARPGIVHRLDMDTSGVLVVAKTDAAHLSLASQFALRQTKKIYLALVTGIPGEKRGVVNFPVGRHPVDRKKMAITSVRGRAAESRWEVLERFENAALLAVDIKTGRTHQIRVHMASIHHPVLGDPIYGPGAKTSTGAKIKVSGGQKTQEPGKPTPSRQMLHAWKLSLTHPVTGEAMNFTAPMPKDMEDMLAALREPVESQKEGVT